MFSGIQTEPEMNRPNSPFPPVDGGFAPCPSAYQPKGTALVSLAIIVAIIAICLQAAAVAP